MSTICLVNACTSWRTWLETRIVRPDRPRSRMRSISSRRATGSVPVSGSSRKSTRGSCTSAWASLIRCRIPLEYPRTGRSACSVIRTCSRTRSAASRDPRRPRPASNALEVRNSPGHPLEERVLLGAKADQPVQSRVVPGPMPQHPNLALAGPKLTGRQLQQGALPRAVGTEQPGHPRSHSERQVVDPDHVAVPLGDRVELDRRGLLGALIRLRILYGSCHRLVRVVRNGAPVKGDDS